MTLYYPIFLQSYRYAKNTYTLPTTLVLKILQILAKYFYWENEGNFVLQSFWVQ